MADYSIKPRFSKFSNFSSTKTSNVQIFFNKTFSPRNLQLSAIAPAPNFRCASCWNNFAFDNFQVYPLHLSRLRVAGIASGACLPPPPPHGDPNATPAECMNVFTRKLETLLHVHKLLRDIVSMNASTEMNAK